MSSALIWIGSCPFHICLWTNQQCAPWKHADHVLLSYISTWDFSQCLLRHRCIVLQMWLIGSKSILLNKRSSWLGKNSYKNHFLCYRMKIFIPKRMSQSLWLHLLRTRFLSVGAHLREVFSLPSSDVLAQFFNLLMSRRLSL